MAAYRASEWPTGNITLENGIVTILNDDGSIYDKIDTSGFDLDYNYDASDVLAAIEFKVTDFDSYYDRYCKDRDYILAGVEQYHVDHNYESEDIIDAYWADDQADFAKYLAAKTLELPDKDKYLDPLRARPTQLAERAAREAESAAREAESAARSAAREAERAASAKPKQLVLLDEIKECFQKYYSTASSETEKETKKIERDCTKRIKLLHP